MALRAQNVIDLEYIQDHEDQSLMDQQFLDILAEIFFTHRLNWFVLKNYMLFDDLMDDVYAVGECFGSGESFRSSGHRVENDKYVSLQYTRGGGDESVELDRVYSKLDSLVTFFSRLITRVLDGDTAKESSGTEYKQLRTIITKKEDDDDDDDDKARLEGSNSGGEVFGSAEYMNVLTNDLFVNHEQLWAYISVVPVVQDVVVHKGNDKRAIKLSPKTEDEEVDQYGNTQGKTLTTGDDMLLFHVNHNALRRDFINFKYYTNSSHTLMPFTVFSYTSNLNKIKMYEYLDKICGDFQLSLTSEIERGHLSVGTFEEEEDDSQGCVFDMYCLKKLEGEMVKMIKMLDSKLLFLKFDFVNTNKSKLFHLNERNVNIDVLLKLLYVWPQSYKLVVDKVNDGNGKEECKVKYYIDYNVWPKHLNNQVKRIKDFKHHFNQFQSLKEIKKYEIINKESTTTLSSINTDISMFKKKTYLNNMTQVLKNDSENKKNIFQSDEHATHENMLESIERREKLNVLMREENKLKLENNYKRLFETNLKKIEKMIFVLNKQQPYTLNKLLDIIKDSLTISEQISSAEIEKILMELCNRNVLHCVQLKEYKVFKIITIT